MNKLDIINTTDLALATCLRMEGIEPLKMELNEKGEGVWIFEFSDQLSNIEIDYENGEHDVEARAYVKCLAETRRQLFSFLQSQGIDGSR